MEEVLKRSCALFSSALVITTAACSSEPIDHPSGDRGLEKSEAPRSQEQATQPSSGNEVVLDRLGKVTARSAIATRMQLGDLGLKKGLKPSSVVSPPQPVTVDKLNPALHDLLARHQDADVIEAVMGVESDAQFEALPTLDEAQPRDSDENLARLAARREAFERMAAPVQQALDKWSEVVRARGGEVLDRHIVTSSLRVKLPVAALKQLQLEPELRSFFAGPLEAPPPGVDNGNFADDMAIARSRIRSDAFYDLGYTGTGFIGLLDTGVHSSHILLQNPSRISLNRDCSHGGTTCDNFSAPGYNPDDLANHGTSSAAVISGTQNLLGPNWRGISGSWVDNFRISGDLGGGTDLNAVSRAYDQAVFWGDWLVVATIQPPGGPQDPLSTGANRLFDLGIAVFASNGNFAPPTQSRVPANATKVLGIGGYDTVTTVPTPTGGIGTTDPRFKPDIRMPTNMETAAGRNPSDAPCDACLKIYGGTSAAAPAAAGTAAVLRHFLSWNGLQSAAGNIYAGLIAFGDQPAAPDNGAGRVSLGSPTCSRWWSGQVDIAQGQIFDIPFSPDTGESDLRAGIWWPENVGGHRDIDMVALMPDGTGASFSTTGPSVFERVQVNGPLVAGNWNVRISGFSVPPGATQKVYYVAYTKRRC